MQNRRNFRNPVSIIIPNYNGRTLLEKNLPSVILAAAHYPGGAEIIVVDDGSIDSSVEFLMAHFPEVRTIKMEANVGFARACDVGIRAAKHDVILLLNTDVRVTEDFIAPLTAHFSNDGVFAVSAMSLREDERTPRELVKVPYFKRGYLKFVSSEAPSLIRALKEHNSSPIYTFYAVGAHCAIDRNKYFALGGFDSLYYPFYSEDVDICYRAWKHGWKSIFEPKSLVYHSHSGPIHSENHWSYMANIIRRNRLLLVWKNVTSFRLLFFSHFAPLTVRTLLGIFVLDASFYRAFIGALSRLREVQYRRRQERQNGRVLSDEEIFDLTRSLLEKRVHPKHR
ncbi:MAG: glycosyltransferase family 2 protein [Candidatus Abyssubacteria bacterium]